MTPEPPAIDPQRPLVEAIQTGADYERDCAELYRRFQRRVWALFARRGFTADECADLTQDTFVRVFHAIGDFHFRSRFERWLFEIAANIYRNELRRRGAVKRDVPEESLDDVARRQTEGQLDAIAVLASPTPSALDEALHHERRTRLRAAIEDLPPQMRRCLLLRHQGFKYREIGDLMRISIQTVKAHLHQAHTRLELELAARPGKPETKGDS
jgi:RNA polymerase sigma-70 factor (ECF subfamily)